MKKKTLALVLAFTMTAALFTGCGSKKETETTQPQTETAAETESEEVDDQAAADEVAALIDAIYVQTRNENTDEQCAAAKAAWDKLTDAQKELVEGENADPDYFGRDTGDASKDDPLNEDGIGENELLVVSFGTSFNDSRAEDIGVCIVIFCFNFPVRSIYAAAFEAAAAQLPVVNPYRIIHPLLHDFLMVCTATPQTSELIN